MVTAELFQVANGTGPSKYRVFVYWNLVLDEMLLKNFIRYGPTVKEVVIATSIIRRKGLVNCQVGLVGGL